MASMQTYPEEFKIEAVKQIAERHHRVADVFVRIGVSLHCLYKWITVYLAPAAERQAQLSQAEELRRLRTGAAARDGEARYLEKWATPGSTGRCNTFGGTMLRILGTGVMSSMLAVTAIHAQVGYLGPAGSWTHQACIDLYGEQSLVAYDKDSLMAAFSQGKLDKFCIPVTTSVVGVTPYMDEVLALKEATIVAEYPKMLGYSLLVKPGTTREQVKTVLAHPVALEEVRPWLDKEMPTVERKPAVTGGAASQEVARAVGSDLASMGPPAAARIYGLVALVDGIEEGPHNVTRWWVIGRQAPAPTGRDKTTLLLSTSDGSFGKSMKSLLSVTDQVLTVYERPGKKTLDTHSYVVEVAGHASQEPLKGFLTSHSEFRLLGSYPRRY